MLMPNIEDISLDHLFGEETPVNVVPDEETVDEETETETPDPNETEEAKETPEPADDAQETNDETEESGEEIPLVEELRTLIGYESDVEYEESPEGLVQLFRDSADKRAEEQLDRIFEEYPLVQQLLQFQLNGGSPDLFVQTFLSPTDYEKIELGEKDLVAQERVLTEELRLRGYDEDAIREEIDEAKSSGRLLKKAERSLEVLKKHQKDSRSELLASQQEAARKAREEQEALRTKAEELIQKSTEIRGIPIPEKDKAAFVDYLFKTDPATGATAYQKDVSASDMDVEIATAYLLFKKFDLSGVITRRATTAKTKSLRERLKSTNHGGQGAPKGTDTVEADAQTLAENVNPNALFGS